MEALSVGKKNTSAVSMNLNRLRPAAVEFDNFNKSLQNHWDCLDCRQSNHNFK